LPEHLSYLQVRSRGRADGCSVASRVGSCCIVATSGGTRCCVVAASGDLAHEAVQSADEVGPESCGADGVIAAWQVDRGLDRQQ
jgi:hypothetical protein